MAQARLDANTGRKTTGITKGGANVAELTIDPTEGRQSKRQQMKDERMLQRAVTQRWPIPEQYKKAVIDRQVRIAIDPKATHRESTAAAKVLIAAEAQNQSDERQPVQDTQQHVHFHQHGEDMNGTGLHSLQRVERLRAAIAERQRASGAGEASGDRVGASSTSEPS